MRRPAYYVVVTFLLAAMAASGPACNYVLPLESGPETTYDPYYCTAQIYRDLPGGTKFTEEWEMYTWSDSQANALSECTSRIDDYIEEYMAPGFAWSYEGVTAVTVVKKNAVDCEATWDEQTIDPPTYGAPLGAELRWYLPSTAEAWVNFSIVDENGVTRYANPTVASAYMDFAERTGLWDEETGAYVPGIRNIRFSDIFVELNTPFALGSDLTIKKFSIQSIGTVIAENEIGILYQIGPHDSKYFMYAEGQKGDDSEVSSLCFTNDYIYGFYEFQGPPNPTFTLYIDLNTYLLDQNMIVRVSLSNPASSTFLTTQPYIEFAGDIGATAATVDLAPDIAMDHDSDLEKILWFENFEAFDERFLGEGNPLEDVPFGVGDHQVTAVAYDARGSYNSATVTVKDVPNEAPVAAGDGYSTDEDTDLGVSNPGVLGNDQDANNDSLTAEVMDSPAHGTLLLSLLGGFVYVPQDDWCGQDSFTYRAHDGMAYSDAATVAINVNCVNDPPDAAGDAYDLDQCTTLTEPAPGILKNDVDVDQDPLTAIRLSDPSNGSLSFASDGSFSYVPNGNWTGTDSFTYKASDGTEDSDPATVTITVNELDPGQQIEKCLKSRIPEIPELNGGQKNSLLTKLDVAVQKYNAGQTNVACNVLKAFENEVISLMDDGTLSQSEGQKLLDVAADIMVDLGC